MEKRQSAAHRLAEELYAAMERGVAPWQKTWDSSSADASAFRPRNLVTGHHYRGGNFFNLAARASEMDWGGDWVTFNQAKKLGGHVRRGEKATLIIKRLNLKDGTELDDRGANEGEVKTKKPRLVFVGDALFNVAQVEGLPMVESRGTTEIPVVDGAEAILAALLADGMGYQEPSPDGKAFYRPSADKTYMPARECFATPYDFYATLMHEFGHATMGNNRVPRDVTNYATEELRAEMAATLTCSALGLPRLADQLENHAAYLQSWLREFADKKHKLVSVASEAQRIADWLIERADSKVVALDGETAER